MEDIERKLAKNIRESKKNFESRMKKAIGTCERAGIDDATEFVIEQCGEAYREVMELLEDQIARRRSSTEYLSALRGRR